MKAKKLLVARIGAAALTFAACGAFPGCNLMPPPSCDEHPESAYCRDLSVPQDLTSTAPSDGAPVDGASRD